jgi:hypothetical protein
MRKARSIAKVNGWDPVIDEGTEKKTHKGQLATRMETTYATLATGYGEDRHGARGACTAGPDVGCPAGKAQ